MRYQKHPRKNKNTLIYMNILKLKTYSILIIDDNILAKIAD